MQGQNELGDSWGFGQGWLPAPKGAEPAQQGFVQGWQSWRLLRGSSPSAVVFFSKNIISLVFHFTLYLVKD